PSRRPLPIATIRLPQVTTIPTATTPKPSTMVRGIFSHAGQKGSLTPETETCTSQNSRLSPFGLLFACTARKWREDHQPQRASQLSPALQRWVKLGLTKSHRDGPPPPTPR